MPRLTLEVDAEVIAAARHLARRNGTTLSVMFSNIVRAMVACEREGEEIPADSVTARLTGALRLPSGVTADEVLDEARMERFGGGGQGGSGVDA